MSAIERLLLRGKDAVPRDEKARHASTIPLARAIAWRWHHDPDRRVRFAMAARLPPESGELASMLLDFDDQVCAMAYERSLMADHDRACRDQRWMVRQAGVAKTSNVDLVRAALRDPNDVVRAVAERRMYGRNGKAFLGLLKRVL